MSASTTSVRSRPRATRCDAVRRRSDLALAAPLALAALLAGLGACADPDAGTGGGAATAAPTVEGIPAELARPAAEAAERRFELTYRTVVRELPDSGRVRIWIPYPQDDEGQEVTVTAVSAPVPHEVRREPEFGNRILYLEADAREHDRLEVEMIAEVLRREVVTADLGGLPGASDARSEPELARWLEADRLVPIHDERIRRLSEEVTAGAATDLEKARAIYDHVVSTMTYLKEGTGWGRGDIYWACDARSGNCTDFHALFTGLARAAGIPAKFEIGFPIPLGREQGEIAGYHCWSAFHLAGLGWVPIDASEAAKHPELKEYYFGAFDENRVEFSEGRDVTLDPPQDGEPLNFFVYPYVEVAGEPHEAVASEFLYRDLPSPAGVVAGSASS